MKWKTRIIKSKGDIKTAKVVFAIQSSNNQRIEFDFLL